MSPTHLLIGIVRASTNCKIVVLLLNYFRFCVLSCLSSLAVFAHLRRPQRLLSPTVFECNSATRTCRDTLFQSVLTFLLLSHHEQYWTAFEASIHLLTWSISTLRTHYRLANSRS